MVSLLALLLFGSDIQALGAERFSVREAAEARLTRHAWLVWPLLTSPSRDLEKQRRQQRIIQQGRGKQPPLFLAVPGLYVEWLDRKNQCTYTTYGNWTLTASSWPLFITLPAPRDQEASWSEFSRQLLSWGARQYLKPWQSHNLGPDTYSYADVRGASAQLIQHLLLFVPTQVQPLMRELLDRFLRRQLCCPASSPPPW